MGITKSNQLTIGKVDEQVAYNKENNTLEIGTNVEVDGNLNVNGEIPIDLNHQTNILSLLNIYYTDEYGGLINYKTPYIRKQVVDLIGKYINKGLYYDGILLHLNYYNNGEDVIIDNNYNEMGSAFLQLRGYLWDSYHTVNYGCMITFFEDEDHKVVIAISEV